MSDTVFRDLFIELPTALFETLQGIGEAAVRTAQVRLEKPRVSTFGRIRAQLESLVRLRYGWESAQLVRSAADMIIEVGFRRSCGHRGRGRLSEQLVETLHAQRILDRFDEMNDVRNCTCMTREMMR